MTIRDLINYKISIDVYSAYTLFNFYNNYQMSFNLTKRNKYGNTSLFGKYTSEVSIYINKYNWKCVHPKHFLEKTLK